MSSSLLSTLGEVPVQSLLEAYGGWYSIDQAILDVNRGRSTGLLLQETGCQVPSGGWNCTAACLDVTLGPQLVWGQQDTSTATLANCLQLPYIANLLANDAIEDAGDLAAKYNILPNNDSSLIGTVQGYPVVWDCLEAFCANDQCSDNAFYVNHSRSQRCTKQDTSGDCLEYSTSMPVS
jgi:hypothetical protein